MNLFIFLLCLLPIPFCFSSSSYENEIKSLQIELEKFFYPAVLELMNRDEDFLPLSKIQNELEEYFLSKKYISENFYEQIIQLVDDKLTLLVVESDTSESLLSLLRFICGCSKKKVLDFRRTVLETNSVAIKVLADICHLFKAPLQRLILTSRAYGHGEMFKDSLVLLESIRKIILATNDLVLFFDFKEKLNFIFFSLDYYFSQCKPSKLHSLAIYESLKSETMIQVNHIIAEIKAASQPLKKYASGLGVNHIDSSFSVLDSERSTTNEDLWAFIVGKVNETRFVIKSNFPDLFSIQEQSVMDVINEDLMHQSSDSVPFDIKKARISVKNSSTIYFTSMKATLRSQLEPEDYQIIEDQIEKVGHILLEALKRFNEQLTAKIREIVVKLKFTREEIRKIDLVVVAVSELAKEKAKLSELEAYL